MEAATKGASTITAVAVAIGAGRTEGVPAIEGSQAAAAVEKMAEEVTTATIVTGVRGQDEQTAVVVITRTVVATAK